MKRKRLLLWIVAIVSGMIFMPFFSMAQGQKAAGQTEEDYFRIIRSNQVTGQIDPADVLNARAQAEMMGNMKNTSSLGLNWQGMGPDNIGSRTRSILLDRTNPATIYAGAVTGGVWKSTTGGSSWIQTKVNGSLEEVLNVTCMIQDPAGTIYAGTGEGFYSGTGTGKGGIVGKGLFKSTDGENFTLIPGTQPTANSTTADWTYINRLAVDQNGRLYAATNKGLRFSNDQGANWVYASSFGTDLTENAWDVKIGSSGVIVACVGNKCYVSENGDPASFTNHSIGGAGNLPLPATISRIELAVAPSNNSVIYAVAAKTSGALDNIYRSGDKGLTWTVIGPGGSSSFNLFNNGTVTNTGFGQYANAITVLPNDENVIFVGGVNLWKGSRVDAGYYSWQQITDGQINSLSYLYLHNYHHQYVFHPLNNDIVYVATDGGVAVSLYGGIAFQGMNRNYKVSQAYSVAPTYKGQVLFGTQGNGVQYISLDGNTVEAATTLYNGEAGGYCAASNINPKAYFIGTQNAGFRRSIDRGLNFTPFNGGNMGNLSGAYITPILLWENFNDPLSTDSVMYVSYDTILPGTQFVVKSANNDYPFLTTNTGTTIFPHDTIYVKDIVTTKFFVGVNGGLFFTKKALDFGTSSPLWFKLANFVGTVQSMANTADGNNVFMGLQEGQVLRVRNINSWVNDTLNDVIVDTVFTSANRAVTSIACDPQNGNNVVITLGNYGNSTYVYRSTNALADEPVFGAKQGNLPAMPVYASLIEMNNSGKVILGTDLGVYATDNINAADPVWNAENAGLANVPVMMLKQQTCHHWPIIDQNDSAFITNFGVIYAASHGRGIFKCGNFVGIDEPVPGVTANESQLLIYPNPAAGQTTVRYNLPSTGAVTLQIISITGQVVQEINLKNQTAGEHTLTIDLMKSLPSGSYIINLKSGNTLKNGKLVIL